MGRRDTRNKRCKRCRINSKWCFCHGLIPQLNKTPVTILMHHRERWLTSNTAHFATLCLSNSDLIQRGLKHEENDYAKLVNSPKEALFLFPDEDAITLDENFPAGDYHLIVPDGTWNQAKKFKRRIPEFENIKTVKIPNGEPSHYLLRRQGVEGGLSTYEAISRALRVLDSDPALGDKLDEIFKLIVKNTMMSRFGLPL